MRKKTVLIFIMLIIMIFSACGEKKQDEEWEDEKISQSVLLTINDYQVALDPTLNDVWIDPMSFAADAPNYLVFDSFNGYSVKVKGNIVESNQTIEIMTDEVELKKSIGIPIEFTNLATNETTTQYIRTLNQGFPTFHTINHGAEDGYYYFEPSMDWICKMSTDSKIVYFRYDDRNMSDFCQLRGDDGEKYYGYRVTSSDVDMQPAVSFSCGINSNKQVILDENYRTVKEINGMILEDGSVSKIGLDCHDLIFFNPDHYITLTYLPVYVNNIPKEIPQREGFETRVVANIIQEVENGQVVFEWNSTDYPILYEMSTEGNDYELKNCIWCDYVHTNSMTLCPKDQNIVISMRNNDSIMEINHTTGEIEWILGGKNDMFGLTEDQKTCRQHFARFTEDGTLTVFDNSTNYHMMPTRDNLYEGNGTGCARGVEYQIDEKTLELKEFTSYEYNMPIGEYMGSAQKISDQVMLLGWGHSLKHNPNTLFSEIDFENNKILFEAVWVNDPVTNNMTYRVNKFND